MKKTGSRISGMTWRRSTPSGPRPGGGWGVYVRLPIEPNVIYLEGSSGDDTPVDRRDPNRLRGLTSISADSVGFVEPAGGLAVVQ